MNDSRPPANAVLSAVVAFGLWGVMPVYWKLLTHLGSDIALAQRMVWTLITLVPLLMLRGEWRAWTRSLCDGAVLRAHAWAGLLLTINWTLFVWATQHGRILEASLGYFINPLLNVLIGRLLLGERLSRLQSWSVACAAVGVVAQVVLLGRMPWLALCIALTFAFYGLARRNSPLRSLPGLGVETLLGTPFALLYLLWSDAQGIAIWGTQSMSDFALIGCLGMVTAAPLLGFAHAARHLPFALLGLLQFIAPTGQFLVGALVYHEPVGWGALASFVFIWVGVALFCADIWFKRRR